MSKSVCRILITLLFSFAVTACGGGGGSTASSGSSEDTPTEQIVTTLVNRGTRSIDVQEKDIFYSLQNEGAIQNVSLDTGEITTLYSNSLFSPSSIRVEGDRVYFLNSTSRGGVYSVPEDAVGITILSEGSGDRTIDVFNDGTYAYWVEGENIYKTPLVLTSKSQNVEDEPSGEVLFEGTPGNRLRMVLDNDVIYVSESITRDIYQLSIDSGTINHVVTLPTTEDAGFHDETPLSITKSCLYALTDNRNLYRIEKDGSTYKIVSSYYMNSNYDPLKAGPDGVYWWERSFPSSVVLKKYHDQIDTTLDIVTIPFNSSDRILTLPPDDANVYWTVITNDDMGTGWVELYKAPISGGSATLIEAFESYFTTTSGMSPMFAVADETDFYWTSTSTNAIIKVSKEEGKTSIITRDVGTGAVLSLFNDAILLGDRNGLKKLPKVGQQLLNTEWLPPESLSCIPSYMTSDGSSLFLMVSISSGFNIYSIEIETGISQLLTTINGNAGMIVPYQNTLFVLSNSTSGGTITVIPKNGTDFEPTSLSWADEIDEIYIDNDVLYFMANGIYYATIGSEDIYSIDDNPFNPEGLLVDNGYVYWILGGSVLRAPLEGGYRETFYSGDRCIDLAFDEDNIYIATDRQIVKVSK